MKRVSAAIITVVIALAVLCTGCGGDSDQPWQFESKEYFFKNWMCGIIDDARLADVVMPGSHDAATLATPTSTSVSKMMQYLDQTQSKTVYEQLCAGVTYLDLRVTNVKNELYSVHVSPIQPFEEVLTEIADFLEETDNFIILDFQHFIVNGSEFASSRALGTAASEVVERILPIEKYALANDADLSSLTMGDIRQSGKKFMIVWSGNTTDIDGYLFKRSDSLLSPYAEEINSAGGEELVDYYPTYCAKRDNNKLFVLQTQPTARADSSIVSQNAILTPLLKDFLDDMRKSVLEDVNVIMYDFVTENKLIERTLELNERKGLVKDAFEDLFD